MSKDEEHLLRARTSDIKAHMARLGPLVKAGKVSAEEAQKRATLMADRDQAMRKTTLSRL